MISVQEYRTFVKETVFPKSLQTLDLCTSLGEAQKWRDQLIRDLRAKSLQQNLVMDPQDDEGRDMPERIFVEARTLASESHAKDHKVIEERDQIRAKKASLLEWKS